MSNPVGDRRNLGTAAEAQAVARVSRTTLYTWRKREWITAYRVGPRKLLYDLDSVAAMVRPIGAVSDAERAAIAEFVAESPDPSDEQIAKVRSVIHTEASTG